MVAQGLTFNVISFFQLVWSLQRSDLSKTMKEKRLYLLSFITSITSPYPSLAYSSSVRESMQRGVNVGI